MGKTKRYKQSKAEYKAAIAANKDDDNVALPKKAFFRQRAHANPYSDHALIYPRNPQDMAWDEHYPRFKEQGKKVEVVDVGCGFGGLLFALAPQMPDTLILGMELRSSVTEFVHEKIRSMRSTANSTTPSTEQEISHIEKPTYQNVSVLRANSMKFMPNFFYHAQLISLFFCFPDPHFKARKHKARIVSSALTAEYAFILRPSGIVYTITDVQDLHLWMAEHFDQCPLFERLLISEGDDVKEKGDMSEIEEACVSIMKEETEEGKKVKRNGGTKYVACWRRTEDPEWN